MKALSHFIVKLADLAEAEGRALRSGAVHTGLAFALALAAAIIGVGGMALLAWALFAVLERGVGIPGAAAICGVALLLCAGGLTWVVHRMNR